MESLRSLLDKFGTPPPEICLDWAWQLEQLSRSSTSEAASDALEEPCLEWNRIGVDEAGQLMLLDAEVPVTSRAMVSQLVKWSSESAMSQGNASERDTQSLSEEVRIDELRRAILRLIDGEEVVTSAAARSTRESSRNALVHRTTSTQKTGSIHNKSEIVRRSWMDHSDPSNKLSHRQQRKSTSRKVLIGLIATAAMLGIMWVAIISSRQSARAVSDRALVQDHSAGRGASLITSEPQPTLGFEANNEQLALSTTDDLIALSADTRAPPLLPQKSLDLSMLDDTRGSFIGSLGNPTDAARIQVTATDQVIANDDVPLNTQKTVDEEIQNVARKAGAESREIQVSTSELVDARLNTTSTDASGKNAIAPLVINCESMRQVFKLKDEVALNPKEPVWRMRLDASAGFVVEPAGVQQLAARGSVFWAIYDAEAKPPRTRIVVQAQQASGRKGDVLWRVIGGSEDLPSLGLPLSRQWLDPLRNRLKQFEQFIQLTRDQLVRQSKQPAIPPNARSLMSAHRQWADQQSKVLERSLAVIAETDRLVGLVDGQFEVHGQLQDGIDEHAPVLLKFGSIETPIADTQPIGQKSPNARAKSGE